MINFGYWTNILIYKNAFSNAIDPNGIVLQKSEQILLGRESKEFLWKDKRNIGSYNIIGFNLIGEYLDVQFNILCTCYILLFGLDTPILTLALPSRQRNPLGWWPSIQHIPVSPDPLLCTSASTLDSPTAAESCHQ